MEDFISGTLKSIIKATNESMKFAKENGAIINPIRKDVQNENYMWRIDGEDGKRGVTRIDFDVAVTVTNEEGNKVGGGLKVQVLQVGGSKNTSETNQTNSRICFSLDVALPNQNS